MSEADVEDTPAKGPGGRPTEYKPEYADQASKLCSLGATDDEIAGFFDVHRSTVYRWKLEHPEFCNAVKSAKEVADERVERSLYQKATGYDYTEEQAFKIKTGQYEEEIEVSEVRKHEPAETTACIFWLKNRRRDQWRDKVDHEMTGKDGGPIETKDVSDLERARKLLLLLTRAGKTE